MFTEILKIVPQIDAKDLRRMVNQLQSRFTSIAKGFGKGLVNVIKGGGIAGVGLALVDKLLNPLKETQDAIDRMLQSSDDIATNAKQFNTTSGRLFKLVQLAKATGLDQDNLFSLISKYQSAVAAAKADPTNPANSAVKNYIGKTDTAAGFFEFIQSVQNMDKNQQLLVQSQVFGEKQILKMASFLQSDFPKLFKDVGLDKVESGTLTKANDSLASKKSLVDILDARRNVTDLQTKAGVINNGMIMANDAAKQVATDRENQRIASYKNLSNLSTTVDKMSAMLEQGVTQLGVFIPRVTENLTNIMSWMDALTKTPLLRGFLKMFGKGD